MVNTLNKSVSLHTWGQLFAAMGHSTRSYLSGLAKHPERLTSSTTSGRTRVYPFTLK